MSRTVYDLIGLAAGVAFILALKGLSHPKTARRGNLIGAFGATLATLVVFFYANPGSSLPLNNLGWILGADWSCDWCSGCSQSSNDPDATTCCFI